MNDLTKPTEPQSTLPVMAEMQTRIDRLAMDEKLDAFFTAKAEMMCKSKLMPPLFRGDQYACYALQQLAFQWELSPALLAPGLYKVAEDAPLSLEGKTVKMVLDRWAPVKDHFISDEYFGDWAKILGKLEKKISSKGNAYYVPGWDRKDEEGLGIILRAETLSGHPIEYRLLMTQCQTRNSTLWAEDPQLQLFYRAVARFARKYFPGVLGGMMVKEEMLDAEVIDVTGTVTEKPAPADGKTKAEKLAEKLGAKKAEKPEPKAEPEKKEEPKPEAQPESLEKQIADAAMAEGVQMTLAEFCTYLSKTPGQYTPEMLGSSRPDWLTKDPAKWVRLAIAEKNKRSKKTADTLL